MWSYDGVIEESDKLTWFEELWSEKCYWCVFIIDSQCFCKEITVDKKKMKKKNIIKKNIKK